MTSPREVWRGGRRLRLQPADLLQSGGEGLVFGHGREALKIYHRPVAAGRQRLAAWFDRRRPRVPDNVLFPREPLHDSAGQVVGFSMDRLPGNALPLKKLAHSGFCSQAGLTLGDAAAIMEDARATLVRLHAAGLVVGDLNDRNLFFSRQGDAWRSWWIDVDSYQVDQIPCPVAQLPFLDPTLYHVADFGSRPWFSPQSDWYAFYVLLHKALLQVHPFGGTHPQHKSLQARVQAGVPVTAPGVTYPPNARPSALLHGSLATQLAAVFVRGQRPPLEAGWLDAFRRGIHSCPRCGADAPIAAPCPACAAPPQATVIVRRAGLTVTPLLRLDRGRLVAVDVDPATGRWRAISHGTADSQYWLHEGGRGGCQTEKALLGGAPGYQFLFVGAQLLIVPPGAESADLLIFDLYGNRPLECSSTPRFLGQPVLAATRRAFYRQAGGYLLRATVVAGQLREAIAADARRSQTTLGPAGPAQIAGYYRVFDAFHPFTVADDGPVAPLPLPPTPAEQRLVAVDILRSQSGPALLLTYSSAAGRRQTAALYKDAALRHVLPVTLTEADDAVRRRNALFVPAADGLLCLDAAGTTSYDALAGDVAGATLHAHPDGLLAAHPRRLLLIQQPS